MGTLQRLLSGARQRKAATIKILKIHHWKNGRKKREEHETKRSELCAPLPWPCCFLFLQAGEGEVFALQTFLFNFSIFINFLA